MTQELRDIGKSGFQFPLEVGKEPDDSPIFGSNETPLDFVELSSRSSPGSLLTPTHGMVEANRG